jgi:hypothetical protein
MTAAEAAEWGKTLSFEKVWAAIMETDRQAKETDRKLAEAIVQMKRAREETEAHMRRSREELDRKFAETSAEIRKVNAKTSAEIRKVNAETAEEIRKVNAKTSAEIRKVNAETAEEINNLSKNVGGINNSLGKWTEQMTAANICEKFDAFNFEFTKVSINTKLRKNGRVIVEIDIFLENGVYVMLIEVKLELTTIDVDKHLERIEKVRCYMDERDDKRTIVAAVAGSIVSDEVCEYAQDKGLYVIVPSGDTVAVANVPKGFTPKEW